MNITKVTAMFDKTCNTGSCWTPIEELITGKAGD